ncbi:protocatechuate 3,4-dioxygenase subunit alpha [Oceanibium sediminis]|uniref:protocatechuate 3,4-dioxygenase subunit alpha n=1 Tax=Oceanibium sediminis TaxID=2026339 RepID=UPI000DD44A72|nr:protocatechuate 3,4-dioxygenase subunit alpha [Oceanibium sediminis]
MSDRLIESASQTAGPYVHIGCLPSWAGIDGIYPEDLGATIAGPGARGERITLKGRIFDGAGEPLRDSMVELWQADAAGLYQSPGEYRGAADPDFRGWGRAATDADTGLYRFDTILPGAVRSGGVTHAPHVALWIVARGINLGLHTRAYFAGLPENAADPVLTLPELAGRVDTLLAVRDGGTWTFDIHLQGGRETVFFDV